MYFIVTEDWLESNKTKAGGYTTAQIKALGWEAGMKAKRWKKRSVGIVITQEQKELFESISQASIGKQKGRRQAKRLLKQENLLVADSNQEMRKIESYQYDPKWTDSFIASDDFLKTFQWARLRMKALSTLGNTCMCCGASPRDGVKICVGHIKPRKFFPKLALDLNNLQILCDTCNLGKGNGFDVDWKP